MRYYVAGPYDGENVIVVLGNIRRGIETAADLMRQGHLVYCPFLDFLIGLIPGKEIDKAVYQENSLSFVEWCDEILLLPGWERSQGVKRELALAQKLGKPSRIQEVKV